MPLRRTLLSVALLLTALLPASVHASDRLAAFSTIHVHADEDVGDVVCAFCKVELDGPIKGDLVSAFSKVIVSPEMSVSGDVVTAFSRVRIGGDATIAGDVVSIGSVVSLSPGAHVTGNKVGMSQVVAGLIALVPLLIILCLVWLVVSLVSRARDRIRYPPSRY